ncbi:carbohydrate ABC transporter permease [Peloplasma aerotolerans]|jgi:ABC-type glycerol-3-phosphate transport system permease component|uniref:Carbohydrate ABC transporter permease n=1 Tax=Peloplasma aerotolerans TaxID=3044389 RepID=A0AAW6UDU5_9MOLU|nr:carbohydrate ABC transporter permease [Mariniplasma sp. M4Ah]MDI6453163.1 carbohydrate ABC transporter permease [Mariniplasma sp. M4Ah]MDR4968025.1 carbohydrate ABC transporter permease [Acholeplasmataceae bacterium]
MGKSNFQGTKINPTRFHKSQIPFFAFLIPFSTLMLLPIAFIVNHAFKPQSELFAYPPRFFVRRPTLDNFLELARVTSASGVPFSRYVVNSLIVTVIGVFLAIFITAFSAYALSKLKFRGKKFLFELNTLALMFVPIAVQIPRYLIIAQSGLIDTYAAHILPIIVMPVAMFLIKQFIDQTPNELIESAKIDGASEMQIFLKIVFPVIAPAIATVGILAFQAIWNDLSTSVLYINDESKRTLAFYMNTLTSMQGNTVAGQGMAAAAGLIMFIPNLVLFITLQSKVMNTMAHSGIK